MNRSRKCQCCPQPRGFGLVQLVVATCILAILSALALPSLRGALARTRADSLRMQLQSLLATARSTAITRQQRIEACPSDDGVTCGKDWSRGWLLYPVPPGSRADPLPTELLLVEQRRPSEVRTVQSTLKPRIQFRADGRGAGTNQTIRVCLDGQLHSKVMVSVPGRIRSERPNRPMPCKGK
ncbi:GspH/FimT family pseudopilin [Stenotrophomonas tumulicola]|uniref:GspH/FimT family pseudopilin n=1 Tax=Stenotrophomonas tumulicola TaxID=1685415 RepID=UPI0015F90809|nr:GspH/FimT family pseudopilin [Stenotrophomonas tumulicola]